MKKFISITLAVIMFVLPFGAFADNKTSTELEKALVNVKTKITVPEELTEFSSRVYESNKKTYYNFEWHDKAYNKSMSVACDSEGRVIGYNDYTKESQSKVIPSFSRKEIEKFAMMFIQKTLPETTRGEGDVLVYDADSYDVGSNLRYSMRFERRKDLVKVKDNYADITVCEVDGELYVKNLNVNYDYDTDYLNENGVLENYTEKYMAEFPAEIIYRNEYNYDYETRKSNIVPRLVYRIKDNNIGYISTANGKVISEDAGDSNTYKFESPSVEDSAATGGGNRNEVLTPQEIAELSVVEDLVSADGIAAAVKKLPYVNFDDSFVIERSNLSKNDKEKYIYNLHYTNQNDNDYRYANITAEADSGKILNFYISERYVDVNELPSEEKQNIARAKISEFLTAVAGDEVHECEETEETVNNSSLTRNFVRKVNGVKYISNTMFATYDTEHNCITSFNLNFTDGEFENPDNAIGFDKAYEKIREYAPIIPLYIKSGGVYRKVYTLDCYSIEIDAVTGEHIGGNTTGAKRNYNYSDIENHWVKEAATKLADIQIGFSGDMLNPENPVTQAELLRFLASGVYGKYFAEYSDDELYESLVSCEILGEEEKDPTAYVTREKTFVYLIRFMNLEKVAKLSDIYKVTYEDGHCLSPGKIGYAAILSGLGIVCGSGGKLRPTDNATRAEAITMLYKYLISE